MLSSGDPLLARQFALFLARLLLLKADLPAGLLSTSLQTALRLLSQPLTSSYAADLLLFLTSFHRRCLPVADVSPALLAALQVPLLSPLHRRPPRCTPPSA